MTRPLQIGLMATCAAFISCERPTQESKPGASSSDGKKHPNSPLYDSPAQQKKAQPEDSKPRKTPDGFLGSGVGKDRLNQLTKQLAVMSSGELKELITKNLANLIDEDLGPLSQLEDKLISLSPEFILGIINNAPSPAFEDYFRGILKERGFTLGPSAVLDISSKISDGKFRREFVHDTMVRFMHTQPLEVISNIQAIFQILSSGSASISGETLSNTNGSKALKELGESVPGLYRDAVWNSLANIPDEGFRIQLAAGIFEGQLANDAISASKWLNTLPPGPEKSVAVRVLVSDLYRNNDADSAEAWLESAEAYLRPGDLTNIEAFKKEYSDRKPK